MKKLGLIGLALAAFIGVVALGEAYERMWMAGETNG